MAPNDVRAYRFRGHRYISTRKFDLATKDLERARALAPSDYDVVYHLGLAYFMTAQFPAAAWTYRACLERRTPGPALTAGWLDCATLWSGTPPAPAGAGAAPTSQAPGDESRIGITDWLYRSFRRAGRAEEAMVLLSGIRDGLTVKENEAYSRALLFYKSVRTEAQVLPAEGFTEDTGVSVGYGLANDYLAEGQTTKACALMRRLVEDEAHWDAFGFIGAEAELTRANGPCVAQAKSAVSEGRDRRETACLSADPPLGSARSARKHLEAHTQAGRSSAERSDGWGSYRRWSARSQKRSKSWSRSVTIERTI
jgi:tetratricopeptide (TPR) repeat protein